MFCGWFRSRYAILAEWLQVDGPFVILLVSVLIQDVARGILPSWTAIAQRRRQMPFSEEQRKWQLLRWVLAGRVLQQ